MYSNSKRVHNREETFEKRRELCHSRIRDRLDNESHVGSRAGTARTVTVMTMDDNDDGGPREEVIAGKALLFHCRHLNGNRP